MFFPSLMKYFSAKYFSIKYFSIFERFFIPILTILFSLSLVIGLYFALYNSPPDYQQGEMVRVMYVHVPSAWLSLFIYCFITICSVSCLVWRTRLSYLMAIAAAPIGAIFAFITLVTGSLWGRPIWGTWWVWDARLTSMLVLFLLYVGYISVVNSGSNILRAEKPACIMAIIGCINIPIVKFSVNIWYSLHQPASILRTSGPAIDPAMMWPLFTMFFSFTSLFLLLTLMRTRILLNNLKITNNKKVIKI